MGFNFELLNKFAAHLGVDLEIRTENDIEKAYGMLNTGEADIVAMNLTVSHDQVEDVRFTTAISETRQVLVQRKPDRWNTMTAARVSSMLVRDQLDLAGKVIYVQNGSSYAQRVKLIQREIGDTIHMVELPYEPEGLIYLVARGQIDYTICSENIAAVNSTYHHNIDVSTPVSFTLKHAWAMRKLNSDELAWEFDTWLEQFRSTRTFAFLYAKYYRNPRSGIIVKSEYYANNTGRISPWDELIKRYSDSIAWDWRLVAALMYQESRFDPYVTSRAGAYGLMQIMPSTGAHFGIDISASPENNIRVGVLYLRWLENMFRDKIADEDERLRFILASYNAGPGHVLDAIRLANRYGVDSSIWHGAVESYILKKSDPTYYNDPEVKHGYFTGRETVSFVTDILDRYDQYLNIIR